MVDITVLDELCHKVTDKAFQTAAPDAGLVQIYASLNIAVAGLLDDLRETFAQHIPGDEEFRLKAEHEIISNCHRRAAELTASLKMGGNL